MRTFTGALNPNCTADIILDMHTSRYYYAGGFDDRFIETESNLTIDDLERYFRQALLANGGNVNANVDALTIPDTVTLKAASYSESGQLTTIAAVCNLAGSGRVSITSEYTAGVTSISLVETSTSDDLQNRSAWQSVGSNGELASPNRAYIRYRVTLNTSDPTATPKLLDITLHDIPKAPYEKPGFARPVILDSNGADTLDFKLPYSDPKRASLDNKKQVQIAGDIYRVRTITDEKAGSSGGSSDGSGILTTVYAEAAFCDLTFSAEKQPTEFNAALAAEPLAYALSDTGWAVGTVDVSTLRTWQCQEKNALAILRMAQQIHGGDLVSDNRNKLVSLLVFSGRDSGVLFAYRKNLTGIKRVVDTRSLVTRLYTYGKDGMTFASINPNLLRNPRSGFPPSALLIIRTGCLSTPICGLPITPSPASPMSSRRWTCQR